MYSINQNKIKERKGNSEVKREANRMFKKVTIRENVRDVCIKGEKERKDKRER